MKSVIITSAMLLAFPAAGQDWSGHWAGVTLGYGTGSYQQGDFEADQTGVEVDVDGPILGFRYERNFQHGNRVFGFDADLSNGVKGSQPQGTGAPSWSCVVGDCVVDVTALLTLRGRYGWLVSPQTMAYGAAGVAAGRAEGGIADSLQEGSSTAVGFTVGGGVSRMVGPNLLVFGEVNYVDLGTLHFGIGDTFDDVFDAKGDFATIKIGASFRF